MNLLYYVPILVLIKEKRDLKAKYQNKDHSYHYGA